jgi:hypothetical protein
VQTLLQLLARVVSSAGAIATAAAFLATVQVPGIAKIALWALMVVAACVIVADGMSYLKAKPRTFPFQSPGIAEFIGEWLSSGGQSAVFSHDLSWVSPGSRILNVLEQKARAGELVLFVGRTPDVVKDLVRSGATVFDYSRLDFKPRSRFTIVDKDKAGARMAIGLAEGDKHVIRVYRADNHAIMALGEDLVRLAERLAERVQ